MRTTDTERSGLTHTLIRKGNTINNDCFENQLLRRFVNVFLVTLTFIGLQQIRKTVLVMQTARF